jgi:hypothetical protein
MPLAEIPCHDTYMVRDNAAWRGSPESRKYLEDFLEHCRRSDLPDKDRIIELLERTLASGPYVDASELTPPGRTTVRRVATLRTATANDNDFTNDT